MHSDDKIATDPEFKAVVADAQQILAADDRVTDVIAPQLGRSISRDGHTAIVQAGAGASSNEMVRAADDLKARLGELPADGVQVSLTGASGMWSDFNEANKTAMMKSELISWPVTLGILLLAFGSLVAAGLPLMLTILGLVASAGSLYLGTQVLDISIWAMNFALMFALALGIDYALFIVYRFRAAFFGTGLSSEDAVAETMDTAGKAVLFSGLTVLISLSAVMLVPSPAFRSMALGIMLSVVFILAATLTLLPAVLAKLGPRVDKLSLPWVHSGEHRSPRFAAWAERLWRRPLAYGAVALAILVALSVPVFGLQTGMPSIKVVPEGDGSRIAYTQVQDAFGPGAPGALQVVAPKARGRTGRRGRQGRPRGRAGDARRWSAPRGSAMIQVVPRHDPSDPAVGATVDRLRSELPASALVGGAVAENHDLEAALGAKTPLVIGIVLALGFLLLLVALQAPILAAVGVVTNLLAVGAAFGVARLVFQEGHLAGLLGLEPQGFLNAWAPVFFFAMVFAISMDYTVFLLSERQGALGPQPQPTRSHGRRRRALRSRRLCRRRGDGRRLLHLRPERSTPAQGDGRHPRHRRPARRRAGPPAARPGGAAAARKWAWWLPKPLDRVLPTSASAMRDEDGAVRR